jgi:flagellar hook-associated protein 2
MRSGRAAPRPQARESIIMSLALSGVFTGIDSDVLVAAIMAKESGALDNLTARKATYQAKNEAVTEIERRMGQLRDLLADLDNATELRAVKATSGDKAVLTVTATEGATESSHTIVVNRLATAERRVHDGLAEQTSLVGEGTFAYTYNGELRTILTTAETTLEDLMNLINNDADNPGVTASILEYESEPGKVFHLILSGNDSGSDYGITIDASTTLTGFQDANFLTTQTAQDSQIRVDGYPPSDWIERSSNTITDVISGVTIDLQGTGTTGITLTRDNTELTTDLKNLVSIYNGLVGVVKEYTGYDEETGQSGILQGDSGITGLVSQVRSILTSSVDGFVDGVDTYTLPMQIGFEIDREGRLELDENALDEALATDYYAALSLIGAANAGGSSDDYIQFTSATSDTTPGVYEVKVDWDAGGAITGAWMRAEGETEWREAAVDGNKVTGQSGQAEEDLVVTAFREGSETTRTAEVRVVKGFAGALYDRLEDILDVTDGALKIKKDEYDSAIDRIERSIEQQEDRLERKEEALREKFARMEATLARLDSFRAAFDALIQTVNAMQKNATQGGTS